MPRRQAHYRERHLGVDGAGIRAKMDRHARHRGYTIIALVEELERAGDGKVAVPALRAYYHTE
jgi:hypothetical protein